jgi:hypothetical protein
MLIIIWHLLAAPTPAMSTSDPITTSDRYSLTIKPAV